MHWPESAMLSDILKETNSWRGTNFNIESVADHTETRANLGQYMCMELFFTDWKNTRNNLPAAKKIKQINIARANENIIFNYMQMSHFIYLI